MKKPLFLVPLVCSAVLSWAGGAQEEASLARSEYLAERGMIIPLHEVRVDEFIGAVDYDYPDPEGEFAVHVYTGHRQASTRGQGEVLLVGVQGRRYRFEELPPMNLVAVVDRSGSMGEPDKLEWVRESLSILVNTLRDRDHLSVVAFAAQAETLLPSTRLGDPGVREGLRGQIQGLTARGDSDIVSGLAAGFEQAAIHHSPQSASRVLLLTDGWGRAEGIRKLVTDNRERGIEVSVIGYGENFDTRFAEEIRKVGGGNSRFVSGPERMEEIFGSGLARTAVPLARNVRVEVTFDEAQVLAAWGLSPWHGSEWDPELKRAVYRLRLLVPVIHSGDYETAVAMLRLPPGSAPGVRRLLGVKTRFTDLAGVERELPPSELAMEFVPADDPTTGFSDARVLRAGTMLRYAQALQQISGTYHQSPDVYQAFFRSFEMKKELRNAATRLGSDAFADQIAVLESYMRITGGEMGFKGAIVEQIIADDELRPPAPERPLAEHLDYLFRELALHLQTIPPGNLAVSGFSLSGAAGAALVDVLNEAGTAFLGGLADPDHPLVERRRLDEILTEQELALSDLVEPEEALTVGRILAAAYLLTGTVIPMSESVVVFARILNVETAVIESVAQVIVLRNAEVEALLRGGLSLPRRGEPLEQDLVDLDHGQGVLAAVGPQGRL